MIISILEISAYLDKEDIEQLLFMAEDLEEQRARNSK